MEMKNSMISSRSHGHAIVTSGTKGRNHGPDAANLGLHAYGSSKHVQLAGGAGRPSKSGANYKGVSTSAH